MTSIVFAGSKNDRHIITLMENMYKIGQYTYIIDPIYDKIFMGNDYVIHFHSSSDILKIHPDLIFMRSRLFPRITSLSQESVQCYHTTSAAVGFFHLIANVFSDQLVNRREAAVQVADKFACARLV
ncbi:MAG: hypothetical protein D6712_16825, partial [Chloroflexi bacterium]